MLKDIIEVRPLESHRLYLRFEDAVEGVIDLKSLLDFTGIFAPLKDPTYFAKVTIHPELGTVTWENGADLDPDVLYAIASSQPIPDYEMVTTALQLPAP